MLVLFYHKSGDLGSSTGFMGWRNTFDTLININKPRGSRIGLFSSIEKTATIKNTNLVAANIVGGKYVGGLVGDSCGELYKCTVKGSVKGKDRVGGLIGNCAFGLKLSVLKCKNYANIYAYHDAGGIIGYLEYAKSVSFIGCQNKGNVFAYTVAGGIAGYFDALAGQYMCNSINKGKIKAYRFAGGIVGVAYHPITGLNELKDNPMSNNLLGDRGFKQCSNEGTISAKLEDGYIGQIAGISSYIMNQSKGKAGKQLSGGTWNYYFMGI